MAYPIGDKLVIAVASSALFDLSESDAVFRREGEGAYRAWMRERRDAPLAPGPAFAFIRRYLALNAAFPRGAGPVEVVLLSRNDPDAGLRVFESIRRAGLGIERAAFLDGGAPYRYLEAFNARLFLSADQDDVRAAIAAGYPAGRVLPCAAAPQDSGDVPSIRKSGEADLRIDDADLRIAFDFDGVLAGDQAERVYRSKGGMEAFALSETMHADEPLDPGPLKPFLEGIAALQRNPEVSGLRTAIITARNAPAHERLVTTLASWGIRADETFFLGGIEKRRVLEAFRPHLFFDDQLDHLSGPWPGGACVHVPFGVANEAPARAANEAPAP